jgi:hypothetical protein
MGDHVRSFGGGATDTMMSPIVLVAVVLTIILLFLLPRKYLIVPFFLMAFFVPLGEQLVVGGIHLFVSRILILFGLVRMVLTRSALPAAPLGKNFGSVDKVFFSCAICQALAVILLFHSAESLLNQTGFLLDYLGGYALVRFFIQDEEDIFRALKCLAFIAVVLGICMVREQHTMNNIFGYIGGTLVPVLREGRVRSQGPFNHALMAGAFGATLVPLFVALWKKAHARVLALVGIFGALAITWASNSSTSLMTVQAGILAICLWPMRQKMRTVRWGIALGLLALHLIMKAPVWFIITHIELTGGNSNYHRAVLIDSFIRHFTDWALIGIKDAGIWGWDLWDAQNQYVNIGETGGLLAFILFIMLIARCFAKLGNARRVVEGDKDQEWFLWLLGCALFANVVAFLGVNYFDNMKLAWFALIAMVGAATTPILASKESPAEAVSGAVRVPALVRPWLAKSGAKVSLEKEANGRTASLTKRRQLKRVPS